MLSLSQSSFSQQPSLSLSQGAWKQTNASSSAANATNTASAAVAADQRYKNTLKEIRSLSVAQIRARIDELGREKKVDELQLTVRALFSDNDASASLSQQSSQSTMSTRNELEQIRYGAMREVINLMNSGYIGESSNLLGVISNRLHMLSSKSICSLCFSLVKSFGHEEANGRAMELLPTAMAELATHKEIDCSNVDGLPSAMSYPDFQDWIVEKLTNSPWAKSSILTIGCRLNDLNLTSKQLNTNVIRKLRQHFTDVALQDLPILIYNLLMNKKLNRIEIIILLLDHFERLHSDANNNLEHSGLRMLIALESTMLQYWNIVISQDPTLGSEFITSLTNGVLPWNPLAITLLLCLGRVHRYATKAQDCLLNSIHSALLDATRKCCSRWVVAQDQTNTNSEPFVCTLLREVTKRSCRALDSSLNSLMDIGLILLDTHCESKQSSQNGLIDVVRLDDQGFDVNTSKYTNEVNAIRIGIAILIEIFSSVEGVRGEIISSLLWKIHCSSEHQTAIPAIACLGALVKQPVSVFRGLTVKLRNTLDELAYLPVPTALALLSAIHPLLTHHRDMRDATIISLRKAMFASHTESRIIAVRGLLFLIHQAVSEVKEQLIAPPHISKQLTFITNSATMEVEEPKTDQHTVPDIQLWNEVIGFLKRALNAEYEVRYALYDGLYELYTLHQVLRGPILDLLLLSFARFYREEDSDVPLNFHLALDNEKEFNVEPLPQLLTIVYKCLILSAKSFDPQSTESAALLIAKMKQIIRRICSCSLRGLGVEIRSEKHVQGNPFTQLVFGSLQICMEIAFNENFWASNSTTSKDDIDRFVTLLNLWRPLYETLKTNSGATTKVATKSKSGESRKRKQKTAMPSIIAGIPESPMNSTPRNTKNPSQINRSRVSAPSSDKLLFTPDFLMKVFGVIPHDDRLKDPRTVQIMLQASIDCLERDSSNTADMNTAHLCVTIKKLSPNVYRHVVESRKLLSTDSRLGAQENSKKSKSTLSLAIELLFTDLKHASSFGLEFLSNTILSMLPNKTKETLIQTLQQHPGKYTLSIIMFLSRLELDIKAIAEYESATKYETEQLLHVATFLADLSLTDHSPLIIETIQPRVEFARQFVEELYTAHPPLAKAAMTYLFSISRNNQGREVMMQLAKDLNLVLGDHVHETHKARAETFLLVIDKTAIVLTGLLCNRLEQWMNYPQHTIKTVKSGIYAFTQPSSDSGSIDILTPKVTLAGIRTNQENECFVELENILYISDVLCRCSFLKQEGEMVVRMLIKLFTILQNATKLLLTFKTTPSPTFVRLSYIATRDLIPNIHKFILYMQTSAPSAVDSSKSAIAKELRLIPALIFAIDSYESSLVLLSKRSGINVADYIKRARSRDFTFNQDSLEYCAEVRKEQKSATKKRKKTELSSEDEGSDTATSSAEEKDKFSLLSKRELQKMKEEFVPSSDD